MARQQKDSRPPRREGTAVYNRLTGNRCFYGNLEDGEIPEEGRTLEPPVHEGAGQRFEPRRGRR